MENSLTVSQKGDHAHTHHLVISFLGVYSGEMLTHLYLKTRTRIFTEALSIMLKHTHTLETTQIFISSSMNKYVDVYSNNGILSAV